MILLLNTATSLCELTIVNGDATYEYEWQADRQLAKGLLKYIQRTLAEHGSSLETIEGIGVYKGPGSFTGLRIGLTVMNTMADSLGIPIVGATGSEWQPEILRRLKLGENDRIVLPDYGGDAHITQPRK